MPISSLLEILAAKKYNNVFEEVGLHNPLAHIGHVAHTYDPIKNAKSNIYQHHHEDLTFKPNKVSKTFNNLHEKLLAQGYKHTQHSVPKAYVQDGLHNYSHENGDNIDVITRPTSTLRANKSGEVIKRVHHYFK